MKSTPPISPVIPRGIPEGMSRGLLIVEILLVLGLSLGRSGVYALVNLIASATAPGPLSSRTAVLNGSRAPGRPWLDLTLQLLVIGFALVPVGLAAYFLVRSHDSPRTLWFGKPVTGRMLRTDVLRGMVIAAVVGSTGIAFYLLTYALGINLTVVAEDLPSEWWKVPVLVLSALENSLLEELVVIGFVLVRLQQLGLSGRSSIVLSALLRGSYHLYQGLGGFAGNVAMGVLFGWLYLRWGRVTPLVVAHTLLDIGAFVGYAVLAGQVSWLPG